LRNREFSEPERNERNDQGHEENGLEKVDAASWQVKG
jgi:hypothetical protein